MPDSSTTDLLNDLNGTLRVVLVAVVIMILATGMMCAAVADSKGRSVVGWFLAGLLFNMIALVAIAGMTRRNPVQQPHPPYPPQPCRCQHQTPGYLADQSAVPMQPVA
jgi:hypothetical protein